MPALPLHTCLNEGTWRTMQAPPKRMHQNILCYRRACTDARRCALLHWSLHDEASGQRSHDFDHVSSRHPDNEALRCRFEKKCLLSSATLTCQTMTTSDTLGLARNQLAKAHSEEVFRSARVMFLLRARRHVKSRREVPTTQHVFLIFHVFSNTVLCL